MRKSLQSLRNQISIEQKLQFADAVRKQCISLEEFKNASQVAIYLSVNNELDTQLLIEEIWQNNKTCYLPVISNNTTSKIMTFAEYSAVTPMTKNRFGIDEPTPLKFIELSSLDIVFTPLVGFDANCNRIGMGAGFYDSTFQSKTNRPLMIGLAYSCQELQNIEPQPWDVPMDYVITEKTIFKRS